MAVFLLACGDRAAEKATKATPATSASAQATSESDGGRDTEGSSAPPPPSAPSPPRPRGAFFDDPEARIQIATSSCGGSVAALARECPLYVMSVERDGVVHFRGTTYVRVEEAKTQLPERETRALFALVNDAVWAPSSEGSVLNRRNAPPVRFSFRFAGGPREIVGDPRCSQDGTNVDRFTLPPPICDLEHALRKVALPFTDCDAKPCPRTPDPRAKPKEVPPPPAPGSGVLEVECPRCRSMSVVRQDAGREKALGKSPARVELPAGRYTVVLKHARGSTLVYPTVREGETAVVRSLK